MDEKCLAPGDGGEQASLEGPLGERRRRAHELLSAQRSQFDRLENAIAEQLQQLAEEVAASLAGSGSAAEGESSAVAALHVQFEALKERFGSLEAESDTLRRDLEQVQLERGRLEQELRVRDALLKETQSYEEGRHVELATTRQRMADAEAQLSAAREQHSVLERKLSGLREQAEAEQEETKAQRRRIAREFKQQHAERLAEFDRRKAELASLSQGLNTELEAKLAQAQNELLANRRELDDLRMAAKSGGQNEASAAELAGLRQEAASLRAQLDQAQTAHARDIEALQSAKPFGTDPADLANWNRERDLLIERLSVAEAGLQQQGESGQREATQRGEMQRRVQMAVEEVRELKRANAELESKLKSRPSSAAPAIGGGLDWEAQKQRLLASLEADNDNSEEALAERTTLEGTLRITDQIVAQKDEEIAELIRQLDAHAGNAASSTSSAVAELLDRDEVVRQERERLAQAQVEWRQKIGQAEIDISLERAKIARERAMFEEKNRQFQSEQDRIANNQEGADPSKPARGRWLARLGLKDLDETK